MTLFGRLVLLDPDTLALVCPYHGPQAADYAPGVAPCGCQWTLDRHGMLRARAHEGPTFAAETTLTTAETGVNDAFR